MLLGLVVCRARLVVFLVSWSWFGNEKNGGGCDSGGNEEEDVRTVAAAVFVFGVHGGCFAKVWLFYFSSEWVVCVCRGGGGCERSGVEISE